MTGSPPARSRAWSVWPRPRAPRCGWSGTTTADQTGDEVKDRLARHHINVSVSRAPSTRLDMDDRGLAEVLKASVHYYNTVDELEALCQVLLDRDS